LAIACCRKRLEIYQRITGQLTSKSQYAEDQLAIDAKRVERADNAEVGKLHDKQRLRMGPLRQKRLLSSKTAGATKLIDLCVSFGFKTIDALKLSSKGANCDY